MKIYSFDYSLVAEAENDLYDAQAFLSQDNTERAMSRITTSRSLLQLFLNQDNMIEDDDVYDGWCRLQDVLEAFTNLEMKLSHHIEDWKSQDELITCEKLLELVIKLKPAVAGLKGQ